MVGGQTIYAVVEGRVVSGKLTHVEVGYKGKCEAYHIYALDGEVWAPQWDVYETRREAERAITRQ